jgi:hypothetical protein
VNIKQIKVSNFLGIEYVELEPGRLTVIAGQNGQGKTSWLKSIKAGFEGFPEGSIRQGDDSAKITIDLGDIVVKRSATAKGAYLTVKDAEGRTLPKAQATLNALVGTSLRFNPVAFVGLDARSQRKVILDSLPVTLPADAIDETDPPVEGEHALDYLARRKKAVEAVRRETGRKLKAAQHEAARLRELAEAMPYFKDAPTVDEAREMERKARDGLVYAQAEVKAWESENRRLDDMRNERDRLVERIREIDARIEAGLVERPDAEAAATEVERVGEIVKVAMGAAERVKALEVTEAADDTASDLLMERMRQDAEVKRLRDELPAQLIAKHAEGLGDIAVTDSGVTWRGRPLENLGGAEQIEVALQIVKRLGGDLGVVCIDGLEALDEERQAALLAQLEASDLQPFVTRVGDPRPGELEMKQGALV